MKHVFTVEEQDPKSLSARQRKNGFNKNLLKSFYNNLFNKNLYLGDENWHTW